MSLENWTVVIGATLVLSVVASKLSSKLGVPVLLFFLALGMLAGSDGPGGVWFSDALLSQHLGVVALIFILFAGGMDLEWKTARPFMYKSASLATVGVLVTAGVVGAAAWQWLGLKPLEALLLGSVVASTDAAAVFSTLSRGGVRVRKEIRAILEMESGSNDPIAIFLTIVLVGAVAGKPPGILGGLTSFAWQMLLGLLGGWLVGRLGVLTMRRLRLVDEAMFHGVSMAVVLLSFGAISLLGGNGFLAVYVAGVTFGNGEFRQRRAILSFHHGIAWLMQIMLFVVLGLLVFPSNLLAVAGSGILISAILMLVARPLGVLISLSPFGVPLRDQALISWSGLRGAVPIVLATYPLLASLPKAHEYFHVVFFVVIFSALLQGTTIPFLTRLLRLDESDARPVPGLNPAPSRTVEFTPDSSAAVDASE